MAELATVGIKTSHNANVLDVNFTVNLRYSVARIPAGAGLPPLYHLDRVTATTLTAEPDEISTGELVDPGCFPLLLIERDLTPTGAGEIECIARDDIFGHEPELEEHQAFVHFYRHFQTITANTIASRCALPSPSALKASENGAAARTRPQCSLCSA